MTQGHPVVERYLAHFQASINEFDFPEQEEITHEIRNHIAEAHAAGEALDAVLQTLGPADVLARAYAVELTLNPHSKRRVRTLGRLLKAGVAAGMRGVWAVGRIPKAVIAAGVRRVWAVGRLLKTATAAGVRGVWAVGRFLKTVAAAGMHRVWVVGRFLTAVVAAGMRSVRRLGGFLKVTALVAAGSLAALIVGTTIGAIGIGCTLSGLFLLVIGTLEATGIHLADIHIDGMPPAAAMTIGPLLMMAGGAALVLLRWYVHFLVTALLKVFPTARGTALARAFSS